MNDYIQIDKYDCIQVEELYNKIVAYLKMNKKDKDELPVNNFGNNILYEMCKESGHKDVDIVASKIWLIGRSYAADLARRKRNPDKNSPRFYKDVAEKLINDARFKKLDKDIHDLRNMGSFSEVNAKGVLQLHCLLVDFFKESLEEIDEMKEQWSRHSLASKYLHFHCPNIFYIYDKRAKDSLTKYVRKKKGIKFPDNVDNDYTDFCNRILKLVDELNKKDSKIAQNLSPRDIDNILLYSDLKEPKKKS